MLSISSINFLNINTPQKTQKQYSSKPGFAPKYQYNLKADTISFSGNINNPQHKDEIRNVVESYKKRADFIYNFGPVGINNIVDAVTPRNEEFLEELLTLDNRKLKSTDVVDLLNHINSDDTDIDEFRQKIVNYKNIQKIIEKTQETLNPIDSELTNYIDQIPSDGVASILKSNLLSSKKSDFNKFPTCLEYATTIFHKKLRDYKKEYGQPSDTTKERLTIDFMKKDFTTIMLFSQVFGDKTCNELLYNRGKYLKTVYLPRLQMLNKDDMRFLRKIQLYGVTDKETKGSDINAYPVSLEDKINTMNLLASNREIINAGYEGINFDDYIIPVNSEDTIKNNLKINYQGIKIDLMDKVLRRIGLDDKTVDSYMKEFLESYREQPDLRDYRKNFWDTNYVHLINSPNNELLRDVVYYGTKGEFDEFIFEKDEEIATSNKKTKKAFENNNLSHSKWLKPTIGSTREVFRNRIGNREKTFYVKNWDRCPQESLFDGNYTTCCTGIDKDHGDSFLKFLTRTCTTTFEVRTEDKGKVVAMSRAFMAKINGKTSMVVENIEVNNRMAKHYLYNDETRYKFREMIFDYARKFAQNINNGDEEIPVYFCNQNFKVKDIEKGLPEGGKYTDVELIGDFPNKLYINAYGSRFDRDIVRDDGDEFSLKLTNITQKAKPVFEEGIEIESDSNYNYADVMDYNQTRRSTK
ncbi:hypothetical protein IJZ97_00225 [bacterium]|nr:hypothetical protein [bacterium]